MSTAVVPYAVHREHICLVHVPGGEEWFEDGRIRRALVEKALKGGFAPCMVPERIVTLRADELYSKERALRQVYLESIREGRIKEVWIAGTKLNGFALEVILATRLQGGTIKFFSKRSSILRRYSDMFNRKKGGAQAHSA